MRTKCATATGGNNAMECITRIATALELCGAGQYDERYGELGADAVLRQMRTFSAVPLLVAETLMECYRNIHAIRVPTPADPNFAQYIQEARFALEMSGEWRPALESRFAATEHRLDENWWRGEPEEDFCIAKTPCATLREALAWLTRYGFELATFTNLLMFCGRSSWHTERNVVAQRPEEYPLGETLPAAGKSAPLSMSRMVSLEPDAPLPAETWFLARNVRLKDIAPLVEVDT